MRQQNDSSFIRNESKKRDPDDQKGAATSAEAQRYNQESLNENTAEYRDIVKKIKEQYYTEFSRDKCDKCDKHYTHP